MKLEITAEWKPGSTDEIRPEHRAALKESAITQVVEQMLRGCTCGELIDSIHMLDDDPEEGVHYRGWWSARTE